MRSNRTVNLICDGSPALQMYSLEIDFQVLGDPMFIDRAERIGFNALPGTVTAIGWQHQYLQQVGGEEAGAGRGALDFDRCCRDVAGQRDQRAVRHCRPRVAD